ncbi:hypothetical protein Hanom_Chr10g00915121 [Helianthus anomalus]
MMPFLKCSRIFKEIIEVHVPYEFIIREFWTNATVECQFTPLEIHSIVQKKKVIIIEALIREVQDFKDSPNDPVKLDEKLVKGCFQKMGYNGYINATSYAKSYVSRPYKFLIHVVIQCLGHIKVDYDIALDYLVSAIVALCWNLQFNFSTMFLSNMKSNICDTGWLMYPRFLQLVNDNQHKDLEK